MSAGARHTPIQIVLHWLVARLSNGTHDRMMWSASGEPKS